MIDSSDNFQSLLIFCLALENRNIRQFLKSQNLFLASFYVRKRVQPCLSNFYRLSERSCHKCPSRCQSSSQDTKKVRSYQCIQQSQRFRLSVEIVLFISSWVNRTQFNHSCYFLVFAFLISLFSSKVLLVSSLLSAFQVLFLDSIFQNLFNLCAHHSQQYTFDGATQFMERGQRQTDEQQQKQLNDMMRKYQLEYIVKHITGQDREDMIKELYKDKKVDDSLYDLDYLGSQLKKMTKCQWKAKKLKKTFCFTKNQYNDSVMQVLGYSRVWSLANKTTFSSQQLRKWSSSPRMKAQKLTIKLSNNQTKSKNKTDQGADQRRQAICEHKSGLKIQKDC